MGNVYRQGKFSQLTFFTNDMPDQAAMTKNLDYDKLCRFSEMVPFRNFQTF